MRQRAINLENRRRRLKVKMEIEAKKKLYAKSNEIKEEVKKRKLSFHGKLLFLVEITLPTP